MKNVLSAVQPTGDLHIGNYFGAIQNWVRLQADYNCTYGVVDYHSMTAPYQADKLRENTWKMVFQLLATGVKPENLFIQSLIPEHTELSWILSCVTSYGEMTRMTQFKDKSDQIAGKDKSAFISAGLFMYPVLQAADILMYRADYVPVGKDQEQHLELSRNIAQRFNHQFGQEYFAHPEPLFTATPKIMSTAEPTKKMSKSLGEKHYINVFGDEARTRKQIRSAVTDAGDTPDGTMSPGVKNLFEILKACNATDVYDSLMQDYKNGSLRYGDLKPAVADVLVGVLNPIRDSYQEILGNRKATKEMITASSWEIRKTAQKTLKEVRSIVGLPKLRY